MQITHYAHRAFHEMAGTGVEDDEIRCKIMFSRKIFTRRWLLLLLDVFFFVKLSFLSDGESGCELQNHVHFQCLSYCPHMV